MRQAVIDIGTNSALLLVGEVCEGQIKECASDLKTVGLGRGLARHGRIQPESVNRANTALVELIQQAHRAQARHIVLAGTHVFRAAVNGCETAGQIGDAVRLPMEILSEDDEAKWSFRGAVSGHSVMDSCLLTDIGGGSSEMIVGNGKKIDFLKSLPVGAVTLTELYCRHAPLLPKERQNLDAAIDRAFSKCTLPAVPCFMAVGGTATTLAAMHHRLTVYQGHRVDGTVLTQKEVKGHYELLSNANLEKKQNLLEFYPERAHIIVAGTAILWGMMKRFHLPEVIVSNRGLCHGLLLRAAEAAGQQGE